MFERAEAIDEAEDAEYGAENRGDELPAELGRREERLRRIREAKRALEERARAEAEAEGKDEAEQETVKPAAKAQYNFTDPESRIMKGPEGFLQGYNAQIAVEPRLQLIVGQGVTQEANDKKQLLPMLQKVKQQSGQKPTAVLADNGYFSEEGLSNCTTTRFRDRPRKKQTGRTMPSAWGLKMEIPVKICMRTSEMSQICPG